MGSPSVPRDDRDSTAGHGIDPALLRPSHDRLRPARDTRAAMEILGMSRQGLIKAIKRGSVPGYAILGKSRARWFVYDDFLDPNAAARIRESAELTRARERLAMLEAELAMERDRADLRRESQSHFSEAVRLMAEANQRLVEAYQSLDRAEQAEASERVGRWVPDRMDGES